VDVHDEAVLFDREAQVVRPAKVADRHEMIFFEEIEDRDGALMLHVRVPAHDASLVEMDLGDPAVRFVLAAVRRHPRP
jgi:hypothetical protein